jgi:hypothetical protein
MVTIANMLCRMGFSPCSSLIDQSYSVALHAATDFGKHHDAPPYLLDRGSVEEIG